MYKFVYYTKKFYGESCSQYLKTYVYIYIYIYTYIQTKPQLDLFTAESTCIRFIQYSR